MLLQRLKSDVDSVSNSLVACNVYCAGDEVVIGFEPSMGDSIAERYMV